MSNQVEFKMELHGQFIDYINVLSWVLNIVEDKKKYIRHEPMVFDSGSEGQVVFGNTVNAAIQNFMASIEKKNNAAYLIKCQFNTYLGKEETLNIVKYICDGDEDYEYLSNGKHVYTGLIHESYIYNADRDLTSPDRQAGRSLTNNTENVQYCYR